VSGLPLFLEESKTEYPAAVVYVKLSYPGKSSND
jgi:hypothetical protein